MSSVFYSRILHALKALKGSPLVDTDILLRLLDHGSDREIIQEITGIDLLDESQIRRILKKRMTLRYLRLCDDLDRRIALRVILKEKQRGAQMIGMLKKALAYPLLLFLMSFVMLLFADQILIRSFQSMLSFMGPDPSMKMTQFWIKTGLGLDVILIAGLCLFITAILRDPVSIYQKIHKRLKRSLWQTALSISFLFRFIMFYDLGYSIDQLLMFIVHSSDKVLSSKALIMIQSLMSGHPLSDAVTAIDPSLKRVFKLEEEGIDQESILMNALALREMQLSSSIKRIGTIVLAYAYLKITLIIIMIYALMMKPVEMMENLL